VLYAHVVQTGVHPRDHAVFHFVDLQVTSDSTNLDNSDTQKKGATTGDNEVLGYVSGCTFLEGGLIMGAKLTKSHIPFP